MRMSSKIKYRNDTMVPQNENSKTDVSIDTEPLSTGNSKLSYSRASNMIWTITQDYHYDPDFSLIKATGNYKIDIYQNAVLAGIYKYLDHSVVTDYIGYYKTNISDPTVFIEIILIALEEMCISRLEKERPALSFHKTRAIRLITDRYFYSRPKNMAQELRQAYYYKKLGKYPAVSSKIINILNDINEVHEISGAEEFIDFIGILLKKHFHLEQNFEGQIKKIEDVSSEYEASQESKSSHNSHLFEEIEQEYVGAEYNPNIGGIDPKDGYDYNADNKEIQVNPALYHKMTEKIQHYYGKTLLSPDELQRLEKKICTGLHSGYRLHITDGSFDEKHMSNYRVKYLKKQKEKNFIEFNDNYRIYNRNIIKLRDILQRSIIRDTDYIKTRSDNGAVMADRLWRINYTHDLSVFSKQSREDTGEFVVDILLDSSGSQMHRQSKVASQGYIISSALSMCNIPNRVMSFNNFLDFTVIRKFTDYSDPIIKNKKIFEYYANGSNRDGLAVKTVVESLEKRKEENKILIVLSDGKPNDIKITKVSSAAIKGEQDYKGIKAIKDTAAEVRKARMKGIAVLGVFTGDEEDLEAEKLIYGKDFAYIHSIERFSDIVGLFLKSQIQNILDN